MIRTVRKFAVIPLFFMAFFSGNILSEENTGIRAVTNTHPKLILTANAVGSFRQKALNNSRLYELAGLQAEEFSKREIPDFRDANNSFREIGDGMPVLGLIYQMDGNTKFVKTAERWISAMLSTKSWNGSQNLGRSSWITGICFL